MLLPWKIQEKNVLEFISASLAATTRGRASVILQIFTQVSKVFHSRLNSTQHHALTQVQFVVGFESKTVAIIFLNVGTYLLEHKSAIERFSSIRVGVSARWIVCVCLFYCVGVFITPVRAVACFVVSKKNAKFGFYEPLIFAIWCEPVWHRSKFCVHSEFEAQLISEISAVFQQSVGCFSTNMHRI